MIVLRRLPSIVAAVVLLEVLVADRCGAVTVSSGGLVRAVSASFVRGCRQWLPGNDLSVVWLEMACRKMRFHVGYDWSLCC